MTTLMRLAGSETTSADQAWPLNMQGLFSATQTQEVEHLARAGLRNPIYVGVKVKSKNPQIKNQKIPLTYPIQWPVKATLPLGWFSRLTRLFVCVRAWKVLQIGLWSARAMRSSPNSATSSQTMPQRK